MEEAADQVEPMLTEPVLKNNGKVIRRTMSRHSYAECVDCGSAWDGTSAFLASGNHVIGSGHTVQQWYEAKYQIQPNPNTDEWSATGKGKRKILDRMAAEDMEERLAQEEIRRVKEERAAKRAMKQKAKEVKP